MYVRYQGVRRDGEGAIVAGSASIYRTVYDPGTGNKGHSRQEVVEPLGRVVWMESESGCRDAIFLSVTRGLVGYRVDDDAFYEVAADDPRLAGTRLENVDRSHVELGPAWLFLLLLARTPMLRVMRAAFGPLYQRVLAHTAHGCIAGRSPLKCGRWLEGTVLSWLLPDLPRSTLDCDTAYFRAMSDDAVKVAFFTALVEEMRRLDPEFGRCCYVDSTPLPGEAKDNPFNELSSHGTDGSVVQSRLALVLDAGTRVPVWFVVIPSNVLDHSTITAIREDVEATLGVRVEDLDLDAGYACPGLFASFNRGNSVTADEDGVLRERSLLVRMPQKTGYPHEELYLESKPRFHDADHQFDLGRHTYYGERYERDIRGYPEYVHVFVDHDRAAWLGRKWRQDNPEAWEALSKEDKEFQMVKDGLFMVVGNADVTPRQALVAYKEHTDVEGFFKDSKSYLRVLPISKWTRETVLGKVLSDVVSTVLWRAVRTEAAPCARPLDDVLSDLRSLECTRLPGGLAAVSTPKRQVREALADLGVEVPGHVSLDELSALALEGDAPDPIPVTRRRARAGRKATVRKSPETKAREREERKAAREEAKANKAAAK